ncbi:shikimate kinase [Thermoflavimicrobium daqui]|nr:shikimate kinase [Thermoflavimicrobium daqui]
MTKQHVILIGLMGTGKTTVGQELHKRIAYPWVDTDQALESKWGFSIARYFAQYGEEAFRKEETTILKAILDGPPSIITTGGGIVLRQENCEWMRQKGWVIHLTAHPEVLIQRLSHDQSRPLLLGNVADKIWQLIKERKGKYDFADITIDTSKQTIDGVIQEIIREWQKFKR